MKVTEEERDEKTSPNRITKEEELTGVVDEEIIIMSTKLCIETSKIEYTMFKNTNCEEMEQN